MTEGTNKLGYLKYYPHAKPKNQPTSAGVHENNKGQPTSITLHKTYNKQ